MTYIVMIMANLIRWKRICYNLSNPPANKSLNFEDYFNESKKYNSVIVIASN